MKFESLLTLVGDLAWFDLATLTQLGGENRSTLANQLHRWSKSGKVIPLRRGMYALGDRYRRRPLNPAALANALRHPSYLSIQWALSFHGLIPEGVFVYTSVTTRVGRRFSNAAGEFVYTHIKLPAFFGYAAQMIHGQRTMVALPEKALLDGWYLGQGEWTAERMEGMRYQNLDQIDETRLCDFVKRFDSPRLERAVAVFVAVASEQALGMKEL
jgi:hypothetical protein